MKIALVSAGWYDSRLRPSLSSLSLYVPFAADSVFGLWLRGRRGNG